MQRVLGLAELWRSNVDSTIHECNGHKGKGKRKEEIKWINSIHQGTGNKIQPERQVEVTEGQWDSHAYLLVPKVA